MRRKTDVNSASGSFHPLTQLLAVSSAKLCRKQFSSWIFGKSPRWNVGENI